MKRRSSICAALSLTLAAALAPAAGADIVVQFASVLNPEAFTNFGTISTATVPLNTDGTKGPISFTITNANTGFWRVYSTNPAVESLGKITFNGSITRNNIRLVIGRPGVIWNPWDTAGDGAFAFVDWVGGVSEGGAFVSVQASVSRNLGGLNTSRVSRLKAGNVIYGSINHAGSNDDITGVPNDIVNISAASLGAPGFPLNIVLNRGQLVNAVATSGDFIGNITCNGTASVANIDIQGGSFVGNVATNGGRIGTIRADGYLGGSFTTNGGEIFRLEAGRANTAGSIGVALSGSNLVYQTATINAKSATGSNGVVGSVLAAQDIFANITAGQNITEVKATSGIVGAVLSDGVTLTLGEIKSFSGNIATVSSGADLWSHLRAPSGKVATVRVGGSAVGNIEARDSADLIEIGSNLSGRVSLQKGLTSTASIKIGRSLLTSGSIVLNNAASYSGAVGLAGQVIVNAGNNPGSVWTGPISINNGPTTITLTGASYSPLPLTLGADADGGAVGVVPFKVHALASFPPTLGGVPGELRRWRSISTPEASPCTPGSYPVNVVKIEHYGPISNAGTGVGLVDIQRRCDSQGTWTRAEELSSTIPGSAASLWDI